MPVREPILEATGRAGRQRQPKPYLCIDFIATFKQVSAPPITQKTEAKYIKLAKTFLGPDKHYKEYIKPEQPKQEPKQRAHMTRQEQIEAGLIDDTT